jgi:hypothetical protein
MEGKRIMKTQIQILKNAGNQMVQAIANIEKINNTTVAKKADANANVFFVNVYRNANGDYFAGRNTYATLAEAKKKAGSKKSRYILSMKVTKK